MALKFNRRASSIVTDWRLDPKVVKAKERLAELDRDIPHLAERIKHELARKVEEAEKHLHRTEMEVLAGRASDSDLAAKQAAALEAKVAHAQAVITVEDLQAEQVELRDKHLPVLEKKARAVAHAALQAKAIALLKEMQVALTSVCQLEVELALIRKDAQAQFDGNIRQDLLRMETEPSRYEMVPNPGYDPDCEPAAGIPSFVHCNFDQLARMQYSTTISSRNASTLEAIEKALAHLEGENSSGSK